jgi:hypothetical protein
LITCTTFSYIGNWQKYLTLIWFSPSVVESFKLVTEIRKIFLAETHDQDSS